MCNRCMKNQEKEQNSLILLISPYIISFLFLRMTKVPTALILFDTRGSSWLEKSAWNMVSVRVKLGILDNSWGNRWEVHWWLWSTSVHHWQSYKGWIHHLGSYTWLSEILRSWNAVAATPVSEHLSVVAGFAFTTSSVEISLLMSPLIYGGTVTRHSWQCSFQALPAIAISAASVLYTGRKTPRKCSWEVLVCCISALRQVLETQAHACHNTFSPTLARLQLGEAAVWTKVRGMLHKPLCVVSCPLLMSGSPSRSHEAGRKLQGRAESAHCLRVERSWQQVPHVHSHEMPFNKELFSECEAVKGKYALDLLRSSLTQWWLCQSGGLKASQKHLNKINSHAVGKL